ncbi:MAG: AMP-binding protein [Rhodobiaceae bacterium]|nr:AMP-binding protein [Rhodobiaceae bacterium]MCC0056058.1 AMP-binding protein [Rhodobiaceae bacterium]
MPYTWQKQQQKVRARGLWSESTVDLEFSRHAARDPEKPAVVAYRTGIAEPIRLSYGELANLTARAAAALRALGIGPGDIVAAQLPNWWEFVVTALAAARLGAVMNPLVPVLREYELTYMLGHGGAKVLIVPQSFRGFDHAAMAMSLKETVPSLEHVIIASGSGADGFDEVLLAGQDIVPPPSSVSASQVAPDVLSVLSFTSGTTGQPKGVMHCNNTVLAGVATLGGAFAHGPDDVFLGCSPLGHMTGYLSLMQGLCLGGTVVLQDIWQPRQGVEIMLNEGVTYISAAPVFLADICEATKPDERGSFALRNFLCSGAPIPPALIERAIREFGFPVSSLWGMTESLAGTLTPPEMAAEKSATSDGCPMPNVDIRIADDSGEPLPAGTTGRLLVRSPMMFMGYFKRPDITPFSDEGWFDSGDLAYTDADGYIRIAGRTKDVIIRGGENVPVMEIENLLMRHPDVVDAALVAFPDKRLGERACLFATVKPGARLDLDAIRAFLGEHKVAKQFWPERVEVIPEMPRTPNGKIHKHRLREEARSYEIA